MAMLVKRKQQKLIIPPARKGAGRANKIREAKIEISSFGAVSQSSTVGNTFWPLSDVGNPFDSSQDGGYRQFNVSLDPLRYIGAPVFAAYEYYRISKVQTTLYWKTPSDNGSPILGEFFFVLDKDSRTSATLTEVMNRMSLDRREFTNNKISHTLTWEPYLVEDSITFDVSGRVVDYVQPRDRWLNTENVDSHRFGTMRILAQVHDRASYSSEAVVGVRHKVFFDFKGQKSAQGPGPGVVSVEDRLPADSPPSL